MPIGSYTYNSYNMNKADIHIETILNATIDKVWEAWTDADAMTWFGADADGQVLKARIDARPGGSFEITFQNSDKAEHTCYGVYEDVQQPNKLSFSWEWKSEPGVRSFVTVLLSSAGKDNTKMIFLHADVGDASAHDYQIGWQGAFLKLNQRLIPS
jgi:uncharacterized protein YndB with AHSA1/START domain